MAVPPPRNLPCDLHCRDPRLRNGPDFRRLTHTITIPVDPDLDHAPACVSLGEDAISIAAEERIVQDSESLESVLSGFTIREWSGIAKQLAAIVGLSVAVAIHPQQSIPTERIGPSDEFGLTIGVDIEHDASIQT